MTDINHIIGIIPARYASTRFPGKPLAKLGQMTVIERVYRQVTQVIDRVIVATDDQRIAQAVADFGGKAVMTRADHRTGTDRCYEAYCINGGNEDIVINIQGDEPFVQLKQISDLISCFDHESAQIATLVRPLPPHTTIQELRNPNMAKVVVASDMTALYFSRSVIPHLRGVDPEQWPQRHQYYAHVGMYGFRAQVLEKVTRLDPTPLEVAESLEQLRWLENGFTIRVATTTGHNIGIDTPQDLQRAQQYLKSIGE